MKEVIIDDIKQRDVSYENTETLTFEQMETMTYAELENKYYQVREPKDINLRLIEPVKDVKI